MTTLDQLREQIADIYHMEDNVLEVVLEVVTYDGIKSKVAYQPHILEEIKRRIYYTMVRERPVDFDQLPLNEEGVEDILVRLLDAINEEIISKIPDTSKVDSKESGFLELARLTGLSGGEVERIFEEEFSSKISTNADLNHAGVYRETLFEKLPLRKDLQNNEEEERYYEAVLAKVCVFIINDKIQKMQAQGLIKAPVSKTRISTINVDPGFLKKGKTS